MSIETKEDVAYNSLLEDIKKIISDGKLAVGIELRRMQWKMGDRILLYRKSGKPNLSFKTQIDLANDLGMKQQRISEYIRFRQLVGDNFDVWVTSLVGKGQLSLERRDIKYFLTPAPKELAAQDIEKKKNELQRQIEKRQREDEKLKAESLASFKVLSIHEAIDTLTNKLVEGYVFPDFCIGLLKTLADEIRKRYPDEE